MDRRAISSNVPAELAELLSDRPGLTLAQERAIDEEAARLLTERLYDDEHTFEQFMLDAASEPINVPLQRALKHLDAACNGDINAVNRVLEQMHRVQKALKTYADEHWREECRDEAEEALAS